MNYLERVPAPVKRFILICFIIFLTISSCTAYFGYIINYKQTLVYESQSPQQDYKLTVSKIGEGHPIALTDRIQICGMDNNAHNEACISAWYTSKRETSLKDIEYEALWDENAVSLVIPGSTQPTQIFQFRFQKEMIVYDVETDINMSFSPTKGRKKVYLAIKETNAPDVASTVELCAENIDMQQHVCLPMSPQFAYDNIARMKEHLEFAPLLSDTKDIWEDKSVLVVFIHEAGQPQFRFTFEDNGITYEVVKPEEIPEPELAE